MNIGKKRLIGFFAVVSLIESSVFFNIKVGCSENGSASSTLVYLEPKEIAERSFSLFTVSINIENVTTLFGWQVWLKWDPNLLEATEVVEGDFLRPGGFTGWDSLTNQTAGWIYASCYLENFSTPGVSGSGTLAKATFRGTTTGECTLELQHTKFFNDTLSVPSPPYLGDVNGDLIVNVLDVTSIGAAFGASLGEARYNSDADFNKDGLVDLFDMLCYALNFKKDYHVSESAVQPAEAAHETQNGHVIIRPVIEMSPPNVSARVGDSFNVSIGIMGAVDFYSLQYRISWNPDILRIAGLFEGDLLPSLGKSFFTYGVYEEEGYAHIGCSMIGPVEVPTLSNGTLSDVEFYAAGSGSSMLNVSDTPFEEKGVAVVVEEGVETQSAVSQKQSLYAAAKSSPTTWTVMPGQKIQDAVDAASPGDRIHVYSGTYMENLVIDEFNLTLIGQDKESTIIQAPDNQAGTAAVKVFANSTKMMEFTVQDGYKGVDVCEHNGSIIRNNIIKNNHVGIDLYGTTDKIASENTLLGNNISGSSGAGVLFWGTENDMIRANNITTNYEGIQINNNFRDSVICLNNIIDNSVQLYPPSPPPNNIQWYCTPDGNNKGNYWNPVPAPNPDPYPLLSIWIPMKGDIDYDAEVGIVDIAAAAAAFGSAWSNDRWAPYADVDKNGIINILDISTIARQYGKIDP